MTRIGWTVPALALALFAGDLAAADAETREFAVSVDGKPAGSYHMTIQAQPNGTVVMTGKANVAVKKLLGVVAYKYTYDGKEVWQANRLIQLDSDTDDNGTKFQVRAAAQGDYLRVSANGQNRLERWDVWATTYWRLPDAKLRNGGIPLIDADTGKFIAGAMQPAGTGSVSVNGKPETCRRFRLTGAKLQVDLWYDARDRLVREESVEDGHKTVLELTGLK